MVFMFLFYGEGNWVSDIVAHNFLGYTLLNGLCLLPLAIAFVKQKNFHANPNANNAMGLTCAQVSVCVNNFINVSIGMIWFDFILIASKDGKVLGFIFAILTVALLVFLGFAHYYLIGAVSRF